MNDKLLIDRATIAQVREALKASGCVAFEGIACRCNAPCSSYTADVALCAALAQEPEPAQEPVAWECKAGGLKALTQRQYDAQTAATKRHYTRIAPPQRPPLTDEEIAEATAGVLGLPHEIKVELARAIERKVRGEA